MLLRTVVAEICTRTDKTRQIPHETDAGVHRDCARTTRVASRWWSDQAGVATAHRHGGFRWWWEAFGGEEEAHLGTLERERMRKYDHGPRRMIVPLAPPPGANQFVRAVTVQR